METYVVLTMYKYLHGSSVLTTIQVLPHPPILRAMNTVVSTLTKNGHNLIQWTPYKHDYAVDMINGIYAADGCTVSTITPSTPTPMY